MYFISIFRFDIVHLFVIRITQMAAGKCHMCPCLVEYQSLRIVLSITDIQLLTFIEVVYVSVYIIFVYILIQ